MGFSREVKDFVAGFQSGWKMIDDAQARDTYNRYLESKMGEEDLSKYDPRLKATPKTGFSKIFGGWFGGDDVEGETPVLEGADRGRAVLDAKMKRAIEQGDIDTYEKLVKQRLLLNQYGTTGAVGFDPVKPPKAPDLSGAAPDPVLPVPEMSRGGMVQKYALGGMAEEMPEDANPARLFDAAQPAVAAGVRAIQDRLNVPAIDDGTPNPEVEKFAKGEGRMSEEEIRALDAKIDPDNELTPGQRSAARLSAIYQFYGPQDPNTAADAAARLLLREKWVSQARGNLALQALEQDDVQSAAKLVSDAYNENLPDGNTVEVRVDPVDKGVVFNQLNAMGEKIFGGKVDKSQLVQLASNTADGSIFTGRLAQIAAMADKRKAAASSARTAAAAPSAVDPSAFNAARANYLELSQTEGVDPAAVQEAEAAMVAELQRLALKVSPRSMSTGITALKNMGIRVPGADPKSSSGGDTLTERKAAAEAAADSAFRGDAAAAIRGAAGNMIQASSNQQYRTVGAGEEVIPTSGVGMAYNAPATPMVAPDAVNQPQTPDEVLGGISNNFNREFAATTDSKIMNMTARDILEGSLQERDQLEANINARKNKREVKFGDQDRLEESINTLFDDLDKGPLAGVAVTQGGGQKVVNPEIASQADVDNLKQWTYRAMIYNDDLMLGTASKVVLGLTSINAKNPMAAPFKVSMDKKDQGRVVLTDGSGLSLNLDGDSIRQILLWRKNKVEEFLKKQGAEAGKASIGEKVGAVGGAALNFGREVYQGTRVAPTIVDGVIGAGKSTGRFIRDTITKVPGNPGELPVLGNPMDEFSGSR